MIIYLFIMLIMEKQKMVELPNSPIDEIQITVLKTSTYSYINKCFKHCFCSRLINLIPTYQKKLFCAVRLVQIFTSGSEVFLVAVVRCACALIKKLSHYFAFLLQWELPFSKNKLHVYIQRIRNKNAIALFSN